MRDDDVAHLCFDNHENMTQQESTDLIALLIIVTKFMGRWGRGTGSWYVVRYLQETFTLRIENEPVNPGRGRRTRVESRRW
jgi:hypothetical protein